MRSHVKICDNGRTMRTFARRTRSRPRFIAPPGPYAKATDNSAATAPAISARYDSAWAASAAEVGAGAGAAAAAESSSACAGAGPGPAKGA